MYLSKSNRDACKYVCARVHFYQADDYHGDTDDRRINNEYVHAVLCQHPFEQQDGKEANDRRGDYTRNNRHNLNTAHYAGRRERVLELKDSGREDGRDCEHKGIVERRLLVDTAQLSSGERGARARKAGEYGGEALDDTDSQRVDDIKARPARAVFLTIPLASYRLAVRLFERMPSVRSRQVNSREIPTMMK